MIKAGTAKARASRFLLFFNLTQSHLFEKGKGFSFLSPEVA